MRIVICLICAFLICSGVTVPAIADIPLPEQKPHNEVEGAIETPGKPETQPIDLLTQPEPPKSADNAEKKLNPDLVKRPTPGEEYGWLPGEELAWDCISKGLEADLYNGKCYRPRQWGGGRKRPEVFVNDLCTPVPGMGRGPRFYHDFDSRPVLFRRIRSDFLIQILSEPRLTSQIKPIGIRIIGGIYCSSVSFENIHTNVNLVLDRSFFYKRVSFQNFRTTKNISIENSNIIETINMRRSVIEGSIFLTRSSIGSLESSGLEVHNSFDARLSVFYLWLTLNRARIQGGIRFEKAKISHIVMRNATIGADLDLTESEIRCSASLVANDIKGDLVLDETRFGRKHGAHHIWQLERPDGAEWFGAKNPVGYFIESMMYQRGEGVRYLRDGAPAKRRWNYSDCRNKAGKPIHGYVRLNEQKIAGTLCLRNLYGHRPTELQSGLKGEEAPFSISLNGVRSEGPVVLTWLAENNSGKLIRDGARARWQFIGVDSRSIYSTLEAWPSHFEFHNVTYPSLIQGKANCDLRPESDTDELRSPDNDELKFWLGENRRNSAQSYRQVIKNLEGVGRDSTDIKVALSQLELDLLRRTVPQIRAIQSEVDKRVKRIRELESRKVAPDAKDAANTPAQVSFDGDTASIYFEEYLNYIWLWMKFVLLWTYGLLLDFGHRPLKIMGWIVACIGSFWFVMTIAERGHTYRIKTATTGSGAANIKPGLFYAIDMFIPFVHIREAHYQFELRSLLARRILYVYRIIGYLFSAFLLAGISGLTS